MFQLTQYASAKQPKVQSHISLTEVLEIIKFGDVNLTLIQSARAFGKGNLKYDAIKTTLLPTFRFNFLFDGSAANDNITASTGLIYLDADDTDTIPDDPYIFAKWKSLSDTGFGILVKVNGLTLGNYKDTYNHLSEMIGIASDKGARKATQQTIQSYDPNLYYNPNALTYDCTESNKVSHAPIKKEEKCIGTNETFSNNQDTIRFNNIGDYFTDEYADADYRIFDVKEWICNPYIPFRIEEGNRNKTLFLLLSQYALLNPNAGRGWLNAIARTINNKMYPSLSEKEMSHVVDSILKKREAGSLELYCNDERRVLFNPKALLAPKEKMKIVNRELGKRKSDFTKEVIYLVLENWNFDADGKITQQKVAKLANRNKSTVKRHWGDFKAYAKDLNDTYYKPAKIPEEAALKSTEQAVKSTFMLDEEVNLYDLLPALSFTIQESMAIITDLDHSKVSIKELVAYIGHQRKQQKYNDYTGVSITPERVNLLKNIIAA
jgi:hypothetical protein